MQRRDETDDADALRDELRDAVIPGVMQRKISHSVKARLGFRPAAPIKVGRNTIIAEIGSGGMGTVYAAFDEKLDRKVAVKVLRGERTWHPRVLREGQALAKVSHPNVVQVYEAGEHDGDLFLSMEFVDGPTLAAWLQQETRTWRDVLGAFVQAGRGLAAAHHAGIIHRDFKPQNVLVGEDGRVRVLDFGLARGRGGASKTPTAPPDASGVLLKPITRSGAVLGTRMYMAPEQHRGEEVDERADQFSFCVALYEALYGARPFAGDTEASLVSAVVGGEVRPPPADSRVPAWVRRVVMKGLSTRPDDRHPSMDAVLEALGRDPARYLKRAAVGLTVVLVVAGLAMLWQRREARFEAEQALLQQEKELEHAQRIAEQEQKEALADEARRRRDGLTLAEVGRFELDRDPSTALARLKNLSPQFERWTVARLLAADAIHRGVASRVLTLPEGEVSHGLSPDGRVVLTRNPRSNVVTLFDIESGESRTLGAGGTMPEVAFSPDGRMLAALRLPKGLRVWALDEGTDRSLGEASDAHVELEFDPVGGIVAYGRDPELFRWHAGDRQRLGPHTERVTQVAVDPSGALAATVDAAGRIRVWDLQTLEFDELPGPGPVAFAPDGRLAWVTEQGEITIARADADELVVDARLGGLDAPLEALAFSPGGSKIACGTLEGTVLWWPSAASEAPVEPHILPEARGQVGSLRWVDDERLATTTLQDLALHALDGGPPQVLRGHQGVGFWATREDGRVVTVGHEGTVRLWRWRESPRRELTAHDSAAGLLAAGPDESWWTADDRGVIVAWDAQLRRGEVVVEDPSGAPIVALASNPDGDLAWANELGDVRVRRPGSDTSVLEGHDEGVLGLAWGGRALFIITEVGLTRWDGTGAQSPAQPLEGLNLHWLGPVDDRGWRAIASSAEERYFVVTSLDGRDPERIELPTEGVMAAAFATDGSIVAFTGFDRSVAVWEASSGAVRELGRHAGLVRAVDVSPDATTVVTAGDDGEVKLWDVATGRVRTVAMGRRRFDAVALSPTGDRFVALSTQSAGTLAFMGRDDLPRSPAQLRRWVADATDLTVETLPIDWVVR